MNIFLSYASEQRAQAEAIQLGLRGLGHDVFFDRDALGATSNYLARIAREIQRADLMIFLVSPQSIAPGRYTLSELDVARRRWPHPQGRVMPVMVEPTPITALPPYLQAVTVLNPQGHLVADVVHAVQFDLAPARSTGHGDGEQAWAAGAAARTPWLRAVVVGISLPLLAWGAALLLVRLDILRADNLNQMPPVALVSALVGVLWILRRRG